ncbi:MAG: hypothetical protein ACLGSH_06405 [Acidobacteriota bacterium]
MDKGEDMPFKPEMTEGAGAKQVKKLIVSAGQLAQAPINKKTSRKAARVQKQTKKLAQKYYGY